MDAKVKKEWVEALRSGKYQQGQNRLANRRAHKKTEYCCLGVLCDITGAKRKIENGDITFDGQYAYLPSALADGLGVEYGQMTRLAELNDSGEYDFNKIADYIEEKL